tara:strand:- start:1262 stop:2017 length:756 start_codon:yes stop_codon:yes gene_type:complete
MENNILNSAYISLLIQIITGLVTLGGVFIKLKPEDFILTEILILETIVQFIEFSFYIWLVFVLSSASKLNITPVRYLDWVITTPTMLLTTIFFMEYNNIKSRESFQELKQGEEAKEGEKTQKEDKKKKPISSYQIYLNDSNLINIILIFNFLMLSFGYLGEQKLINKWISFFFGFVFFSLSFFLIYDNYAVNNMTNLYLFYFMFIIWSLYGIAFLFSYTTKNIFYNILDTFSKNFYGLFILYVIYKIKMSY